MRFLDVTADGTAIYNPQSYFTGSNGFRSFQADGGSHGLADDALTCIALALNPAAKLLLAPAMNGKMWLHPATRANVAVLRDRGAELIGPEEGLLSCGYEGLGRLWPVDQLASRVEALLT